MAESAQKVIGGSGGALSENGPRKGIGGWRNRGGMQMQSMPGFKIDVRATNYEY